MRFSIFALGLLLAGARAEASPAPIFPPVELYTLNTHESYVLRPDNSGRFGASELAGWTRFLRCHHTGRSHAMAWRVAPLLYDTARHFGLRRVLVVAGYRAPRIARQKGNPASPHKDGRACDFRIDGITIEALRDYLRAAYNYIGVGYYPNSNFVHLDVGRKSNVYWVDTSAPGQSARYARTSTILVEDERGPRDKSDESDEGDDNSSDKLP